MQSWYTKSAILLLQRKMRCNFWLAKTSSAAVQSDQGKCYYSNITNVGLGLLNYVKPVRAARYIQSGVLRRELLDAHFAGALAHVLAGLRQLHCNRTEMIATAAGLAAALRKPWMSNHVVSWCRWTCGSLTHSTTA
jgi:hypothetical protein